jgi:hypothetical protein
MGKEKTFSWKHGSMKCLERRNATLLGSDAFKILAGKYSLADTFDFSPSFQCSNLLSEVLLQ